MSQPYLGFVTKARACEGVGQKWNLEVTFHVPKSVGECEGINLHTPKWAPTLGVGILMDSRIFKKTITRVQTHWIEMFLISLKNSWNLDV
jgi:hypothetical protein